MNAINFYDNGDAPTARGFVEPNPEFYRRLSRLIERIQQSLRRAGAMQRSFGYLRIRLRKMIRINKFFISLKGKGKWAKSEEEFKFLLWLFMRAGSYDWVECEHHNREEMLLAGLVQLLAAVEREELPDDPNAVQVLIELSGQLLEPRWKTLTQLCRRLEQLAVKQIQGEEFDENDDQFLIYYGDNLAALLLYEHHAGTEPDDDRLRAVTVLTTRHGNTVGDVSHFHAAVGRPRAIYVLYPYKGEEILCRGAVLPYFEFTHDKPLTDDEWKALHDSPECPKQPDWLKQLVAQ